MQTEINLNYLAIVAAIAANIAIGFLWYGPVLGKAWMKEAGMPADHKPEAGAMTRAMILMVVGSCMTAFMLAYSIEVWRLSAWKVGAEASNATYGFFPAFFAWIGFYVPALFSGVAWENKSWKLFGINAGYYIVALLAMGMILAFWR